ncbi:MAG: AIR synthase-related protein, partial [Candidatus Eremiobacteraeota bacterium]|nr:AIR synthase-related protein [Candidatus Eremiobacteraeota bacterium]
RRNGGRPNDVLAVTGPLGLSRAGLELTRRPDIVVAAALRERALAAFATPAPRLREGRWLAASSHVHAMMDLSDGISTDVARLAAASACGALVEPIALHPAVRAIALAAGHRPERYVLDGGEDFELLVSVAPRAFTHLAHRFATRFGRPLVAVGRLEHTAGVRLDVDGAVRPLEPRGYDHLRDA